MNRITQDDLKDIMELRLPCNYRVSKNGKLEVETLKDQNSKWHNMGGMGSFYRVSFITQYFGRKHRFYNELGLLGHNGIDFSAPLCFNISSLKGVSNEINKKSRAANG